MLITLKTSKLEHKGIQISVIGEIIKVGQKKGGKRFLTLQSELDGPNILTGEKKEFPFKFPKVQMNYESYKGDYISVRYYVKVKILASLKDVVHEDEFTVVNPVEDTVLQEDKESINLCVGIQDLLKINIDFPHKRYNYRGIIEGKITFLQVGMPLTFMELQIIKRETFEKGDENQGGIFAKFSIMDGGPVKNETIPIRMFLKPYDLTPTYESVNNQFSVRYYINLVLEDNEQNRFFKQKEIIFYRIKKKKREYEEPGLLARKAEEEENKQTNTGVKEEEVPSKTTEEVVREQPMLSDIIKGENNTGEDANNMDNMNNMDTNTNEYQQQPEFNENQMMGPSDQMGPSDMMGPSDNNQYYEQ